MWKQTVLAFGVALALGGCSPKDKSEESSEPTSTSAKTAPALSAKVKPALWKTGDADTTIYLFGTVHVLPPGLDWRTDELVEALDASQAVYFETDVEPSPVEISSLIADLGVYQGGDRLSNHLSPAQRQRVSEELQKVGVAFAPLETYKPWLVATLVGEHLIQKAGYTPESGVEHTLIQLAKQRGKEIRKLETVEQQLRIFADLPEPVQIDYLVKGVDRIEDQVQLLHNLVTAWSKGDVDQINHLMIEEDLAGMPEIYQALLVTRNRNWTDALAQLAKEEPGTFLVAVGAAHLVGEDSVVSMLNSEGVKAIRVE